MRERRGKPCSSLPLLFPVFVAHNLPLCISELTLKSMSQEYPFDFADSVLKLVSFMSPAASSVYAITSPVMSSRLYVLTNPLPTGSATETAEEKEPCHKRSRKGHSQYSPDWAASTKN